MNLAETILNWQQNLQLDPSLLPDDIRVMNPYRDMLPSTRAALETFYHRFYGDDRPRQLLLGINPGRLGAGQTGIPFTDTVHLEQIGISMPDIRCAEPSADFVWQVVNACGGPEAFFGNWFIGAVSPLGFIRNNSRGNWVNFNYYDDPKVEKLLTPYMAEQLRQQKEIAGGTRNAVVLGTGKNLKSLNRINEAHDLFDTITPLEHPRFIIQYRRRHLTDYLEKFVRVLDI